jgi:hypothetical protein
MVSSDMLRRVALVRTDVSEDPSASSIRVTRIGELGTTDVSEELSACIVRVTRIGEIGTGLVKASVLPSSPILVTLMKEAYKSHTA